MNKNVSDVHLYILKPGHASRNLTGNLGINSAFTKGTSSCVVLLGQLSSGPRQAS